MPVVLVSACLLGARCRYAGDGKRIDGLDALMRRAQLAPVCPEIYGGLPTPRAPAERRGTRVIARDGTDVTPEFERGAQEALKLAELFGARFALLKERSPSCGSGEIYDGSFAGVRVKGDGVAAALLKTHGVEVYGESRIEELLARLKETE